MQPTSREKWLHGKQLTPDAVLQWRRKFCLFALLFVAIFTVLGAVVWGQISFAKRIFISNSSDDYFCLDGHDAAALHDVCRVDLDRLVLRTPPSLMYNNAPTATSAAEVEGSCVCFAVNGSVNYPLPRSDVHGALVLGPDCCCSKMRLNRTSAPAIASTPMSL